MKKGDSKGYYAILGVTPSATAAEIKNAYRAKAQKLHPDKNPTKDTTRDFQHLQEAFNTLKNPKLRTQYDSFYPHFQEREPRSHHRPQAQRPHTTNSHSHPISEEPIICSRCATVSAQPRYVIFFAVKSFLIMGAKTPLEGIFCSKCACLISLKASLVTWVFGWWGLFPWGIIWSAQALFTNLLGGIRPPDINARILGQQASYFKGLGKLKLAKAILRTALEEAEKFQSNPNWFYQGGTYFSGDQTLDDYFESFNNFYENLKKLDTSIAFKNFRRLKNPWGLFNNVFIIQLIMIIISFTLILDLFR
ncbi:MAG: J domain-containing protein [Candidatus Paracaedibacter sp.]